MKLKVVGSTREPIGYCYGKCTNSDNHGFLGNHTKGAITIMLLLWCALSIVDCFGATLSTCLELQTLATCKKNAILFFV